jgi:hypothetical protein
MLGARFNLDITRLGGRTPRVVSKRMDLSSLSYS